MMVSNGKTIEPTNLTADLTTTLVGSNADFPVERVPVVYHRDDGSIGHWQDRHVIYRTDMTENSEVAIASNKYALVTNRQCFELIENSIRSAGIDNIRAGVSVMRNGAKFRARYVLPDCKYDVAPNDTLCCTILVAGSYDGSTRLSIEVGAYRFVCTNLMTGGGGILGGGFSVLHKGNLEEEILQTQPMVTNILETFPERAAHLSRWADIPWTTDAVEYVSETIEENAGMAKHTKILMNRWNKPNKNLWWAYNEATDYATHQTKSVGVAYRISDVINKTFLSYYGALAPLQN